MKIYGDIVLDPAGNQIANLRLENLGSAPLTSSGRIYFNTATKKVMVWNGTSWLQITSSPEYYAGDGLMLDGANHFHIHLFNDSANTSGLQFNGGYLQLKVAPEFQLDGDGISITTGGVTAAMLAGSIPDSLLLQITTAGKVAASAVEDKFLRNDADDDTSGTLQVKDLILYPETVPSTALGKMYYDSGDNKIYFYNGSGWQEIYTGSANVHSATGTAPITVSPTTGDVVVSMSQSSSIQNGWLSSTDWNTFNNKQTLITWGNGLQFVGSTASVLLATTPGLEFATGALRAKLKPAGGISVDAAGLYVNALYAGFQAVYNFDPFRPAAHFHLDIGGSFSIINNTDTVTVLQAYDGTLFTSGVVVSNMVVQQDLDVLGANSRLRTSELYVRDRSVSLGFENPLIGSPATDTYIDVLRGSDPTVALRYHESSNEWEYTNDGTIWLPFNNGCLKYNQAFTGLDSITVTHGLNDLNPIVQVYDNTGYVIEPLEIYTIDANNTLVTLDAAQDGVIAVVGGVSAAFGGGSSGRYSQLFNLPGPGSIIIIASSHGLGTTSDLIVQVMSFAGGVASIVQPDSTTITVGGTVTLSFLGAINGKVLIMK